MCGTENCRNIFSSHRLFAKHHTRLRFERQKDAVECETESLLTKLYIYLCQWQWFVFHPLFYIYFCAFSVCVCVRISGIPVALQCVKVYISIQLECDFTKIQFILTKLRWVDTNGPRRMYLLLSRFHAFSTQFAQPKNAEFGVWFARWWCGVGWYKGINVRTSTNSECECVWTNEKANKCGRDK